MFAFVHEKARRDAWCCSVVTAITFAIGRRPVRLAAWHPQLIPVWIDTLGRGYGIQSARGRQHRCVDAFGRFPPRVLCAHWEHLPAVLAKAMDGEPFWMSLLVFPAPVPVQGKPGVPWTFDPRSVRAPFDDVGVCRNKLLILRNMRRRGDKGCPAGNFTDMRL